MAEDKKQHHEGIQMIIIKIGGGKEINILGIIKDLAELSKQEENHRENQKELFKFMIIHGANAARDQLASDLGREKKVITSVSGYSSVFSDETAIDLIRMAYAGLQNSKIVELCQQNGINAVGLSGIDGRLVQGKRSNGIRVKEDGKLKIVRDFSGKPKEINKHLLDLLLENNYVPVLSIPIIDEENYAINSENDDIVTVLQQSLRAEKVINLIEAPGFLDDKDNPKSLIKQITKQELIQREEQVEGRMKRKMLALRKLFEGGGASTVIISDGRIEHPVKDALNGGGTIIK